MTETQNLPSFPPPSFLRQPFDRRLPQPVQLPPLSIPPSAPVRPDYPFSSPASRPLPSIQTQAPVRPQPRSHLGSAAPVEKLLSSNPYTPPRSDSTYSPPQYGRPVSPRSEAGNVRHAPRFNPWEEQRPANLEPSTSTGSARIPTLIQKLRSVHYELRVRQQPIAARACGFGERDRRVIDPPPIIQLLVTDPKTGATDQDELRYSLNVVHCTLWNAEGTNEETALVQPDRRTTRRLMGQLVASPSVAKDEHDVEGCFFCFPDLSCRTHGRYRLRFVLMRIDPMNLHVGGLMPILTEVLSDVFDVYTAKDFPGMRQSSALTRALKLQGCNIQVKKGNEKARARRRASNISEEDDGAEDKDSVTGRKRRRE
ncbi:hypothetical protein K490DRAFT_47109 [Saccharata proteae CBS 121410]|uniref:Velvet domain-containing protein n=1 Tax=Saccharata proteae CBS 121410 TaxID=1314787 RepID=A0A9P4HSP3_9PEZI|nr:hypothetical protein K490DRAFT_47109 [Saccharata proteae CBS 121410]